MFINVTGEAAERNLTKAKNNSVIKFIVRNMSLLIALIFISTMFSLISNRFFTVDNMFNVLRQISMNAIIAMGMTFVLLIGGIDLSVGSMLAATNCMTISLMVWGVPMGLAIISGIALSAFIGLFNGVIIAKGKIPPFITTLAMMTIARGMAYVYTDGKPLRFDDPVFEKVGSGYVGPIPVPVIIMVVCLLIASFILNKTKFGKYVYAVGGNREAAKFSGIRINKIEIIVYVICGLMTGISGVILGSRMASVQPTAGNGAELDAIAAVVLGGTSLSGGVGSVGGTMIGSLFIGILNNGMNIIKVPSYWQLIIKGAVIIAAVFMDSLKKNKRAQ